MTREGTRGTTRQHFPAVLLLTRLGFVRAVLVVENRIRAVEGGSRDALFIAQRTARTAQRRMGLWRYDAEAAPFQHQRAVSAACSRSMLSNNARKLPAPKPLSPFLWISS